LHWKNRPGWYDINFPFENSKEMDLKDWFNEISRNKLIPEENRIYVIGIIGKSSLNDNWDISKFINHAFRKDLFACTKKYKSCCIEAAFDCDSSILLLRLVGPNDLSRFSLQIENVNFNSSSFDMELEYTTFVAYLLMVSHVILLYHPTCDFDMNFLRLFRNANWYRQIWKNDTSEILKNLAGACEDFIYSSRLAIPRLLFCSARAPKFMRPDGKFEAKQVTYNTMEMNAEAMILDVFDNVRLAHTTYIKKDMAFSFPEKERFVLILPSSEEPCDPLWDIARNMNSWLKMSRLITLEYLKSQNDDLRPAYDGFRKFLLNHVDAVANDFDNDDSIDSTFVFQVPNLELFIQFASKLYENMITNRATCTLSKKLAEHLDVDTVLSRELCDRALPLAKDAYEKGLPEFYPKSEHLSKLAQAILVLKQEARGLFLEETIEALKAYCEETWKAGRQQCEAISVTGNICMNPRHRTCELEESSSLPIMPHIGSLNYISTCNCGHKQSARADPFDLLSANYGFYEENGLFRCCSHLEKFEFTIYDGELPEADCIESPICCSSEILQVPLTSSGDSSSSNEADDKNMEMDMLLPDRDNLPAFSFEKEEKFLSSSSEERHSLGQESVGRDRGMRLNSTTTTTTTTSTDSLETEEALSIEDSHELAEESPDENDENYTMEDEDDAEIEDETDDDASESCLRHTQVKFDFDAAYVERKLLGSTAGKNYYWGLPSNRCPPDTLPVFPSWAVTCIGSSSLYTHAHGIRDQPNFTRGSNYLLPWDVNVTVDVKKWQQWMNTTASYSKRMSYFSKKPSAIRNGEGIVHVKVFVGFEYECSRGHRFMMESPDKILKHNGPYGPTEDAEAILYNDMPLMFPCSCRSTGPFYLGQLMRIHVVTPKAPVVVQIRPRIQIQSAQSIIFDTGVDDIQLESSKYWIVRLPYAYYSVSAPIYLRREGSHAVGKNLWTHHLVTPVEWTATSVCVDKGNEKMSIKEDSNKALAKISLPLREVKVWLSCTQWRHFEFEITNPTDVIIGFHLKSTRPSAINVHPTYGFIEKRKSAVVKIHFPKVDEYNFTIRADRLTVLLAVKPEDLSFSEPSLLWDGVSYLPDIYARRCIIVNYKIPFENETIKRIRKSLSKGKTATEQQINGQKKQCHQDAETNAAAQAQASKTVQSNDNEEESEEEGSTEDVANNEKGEAEQDKQ
ncbi:Protein SMG8, partial [Trichinella sp. T9]